MLTTTEPSVDDFARLPDLALRTVGGAVIWATDEFFAPKENLIAAGGPEFQPTVFGPKGKVFDGWETRRRRGIPGTDSAIVRLGMPGIVRGVVVDTTWFKGNCPPEISVDALEVDGYPTADIIAERTDWTLLVPRQPVNHDSRNAFPVTSNHRWTHVRLCMHPDGGIARLRVHGQGHPGSHAHANSELDLAAAENGALVVDCSDEFYSPPQQLLYPGPARSMSEGWATARRRSDGNEWVRIRLAYAGFVRLAEIDTSYFIGNSPAVARLTGTTVDGSEHELLPRTKLLPDTRHRFPITNSDGRTEVPVALARLDIYPDGGVARLRLYGAPHAS